MTAPRALVVTCEHGGNRVPAGFSAALRRASAQLHTHRGYDPGALDLARALAARFEAPLFFSRVTRLLIDCNRSIGRRSLFSEFSSGLDARTKDELIERFHAPLRSDTRAAIEARLAQGMSVLHLSVHSFTPRLRNKTRTAEIGLLYDPRRAVELRFCERWAGELRRCAPQLRIRRNYPYRGASDGHTAALRDRFDQSAYLGIELELNQALLEPDLRLPAAIKKLLFESLRDCLNV